eukprot:4228169-Pyramimonas_sp.AAC.1
MAWSYGIRILEAPRNPPTSPTLRYSAGGCDLIREYSGNPRAAQGIFVLRSAPARPTNRPERRGGRGRPAKSAASGSEEGWKRVQAEVEAEREAAEV